MIDFVPKISVIVPIYNVENYIERCARSLFEQTLSDVQYIFVDDCTPDNSIDVLKKTLNDYPDRQNNTIIISHSENRGLPAARESGVKVAEGEYVLHCDSDDWMELNMCEKLYNTALEGNHDVVICDYYKSESTTKYKHIKQNVSEDKVALIKSLINETVHGAVWNKLVRRQMYQSKIFYPKDNLREDLTLSVQLISYAQKIKYISFPLYHYFDNNASITQKELSYEMNLERHMQSIRNCQLLEDFLCFNDLIGLYQEELDEMKIRLKLIVAKLMQLNGRKSEWKHIFPEQGFLNILRSKHSARYIIIYMLITLNLYPIIRKIIKPEFNKLSV